MTWSVLFIYVCEKQAYTFQSTVQHISWLHRSMPKSCIPHYNRRWLKECVRYARVSPRKNGMSTHDLIQHTNDNHVCIVDKRGMSIALPPLPNKLMLRVKSTCKDRTFRDQTTSKPLFACSQRLAYMNPLMRIRVQWDVGVMLRQRRASISHPCRRVSNGFTTCHFTEPCDPFPCLSGEHAFRGSAKIRQDSMTPSRFYPKK